MVAAPRLTPAPANDTRPSIPNNSGKLSAPDLLDTAALNTLKWRELGPFRGGRYVAVAVSASSPDVVYVGGGEYALRGNV